MFFSNATYLKGVALLFLVCSEHPLPPPDSGGGVKSVAIDGGGYHT